MVKGSTRSWVISIGLMEGWVGWWLCGHGTFLRLGCGSGLMYESLGWWVVCGMFDNRWVCRKARVVASCSWLTMHLLRGRAY